MESLYKPDFENSSIFSDIANADEPMMGGTPYAHAPLYTDDGDRLTIRGLKADPPVKRGDCHEHSVTEKHPTDCRHCRGAGPHWRWIKYPSHANARILRCRVGHFGVIFSVLGLRVGKRGLDSVVSLAVHQ
jgi:hypothetical protein